MFSKIAFFALLVTAANASGGYSSFSYGVSDPNTGDIKDQQENRVGGNVVGKYSLLESDGTKRIVEHSADDATGFKAVVHKEPVGAFGAGAIGGSLAGSYAHGVTSLAHGSLSTAGYAAPYAAGSPVSHSSLAATSPLAYGNAAGLSGYAGSLYGGYGNTLGSSLGYAGRGTPTVSSYSHSIVHNGPDSYPNGGAYGRYGINGGYGAPSAGAALAHGNPWAANSGLAHGTNPWASGAVHAGSLSSTLAAGAHGSYTAGLGHGNRLGW